MKSFKTIFLGSVCAAMFSACMFGSDPLTVDESVWFAAPSQSCTASEISFQKLRQFLLARGYAFDGVNPSGDNGFLMTKGRIINNEAVYRLYFERVSPPNKSDDAIYYRMELNTIENPSRATVHALDDVVDNIEFFLRYCNPRTRN